MMLLIGTVLNAESQSEKDLRRIFPLAENWTLFTTDFGNYFSTKISIKNNKSPLIINYQIIDSENKPIYTDIIRVPYEVKTKGRGKEILWISTITFIGGLIIGGLVF